MLSKYNKAWAGALGLAVNLLYQYNISKPNVWVSAILSLATLAGIYGVKNATP